MVDSYAKQKYKVVITGKGPLKAHYQEVFAARNDSWTNVNIETVWLDTEDYPKLVGSADIGVCLHFSSSGLDLPMKVVDMFSAQLPCFAIEYRSISELVKDKVNGRVFKNEDQLYEMLINGVDNKMLEMYRGNLKGFSKETWEDQWQRVICGEVLSSKKEE